MNGFGRSYVTCRYEGVIAGLNAYVSYKVFYFFIYSSNCLRKTVTARANTIHLDGFVRLIS